MCNALSHRVGGVIVGKNEACIPTVFHWEWPQEVKDLFYEGHISNSNLEIAGLLPLWLVMESVCGNLREKRVALFSDNSPTVGWVQRLATCGTMVSAHLIRALALRLKPNRTCPITPLHIAREENSMTDIPSWSFGRKPKGTTGLTPIYSPCSITSSLFPLRTPGPSSRFPTRSICE